MLTQQNGEEKGWIITFSGIQFFPLAPVQAAIEIQDVAHALARQCRFGGHCKEFHSVAQHSSYVARLLKAQGWTDRACLAGLLHDASEAYLVDVPRPIKHSPAMVPYREAEKRLQAVVYERFDCVPEETTAAAIHNADESLLHAEAKALFARSEWAKAVKLPFRIEPTDPAQAERGFLKLFATFGGEA